MKAITLTVLLHLIAASAFADSKNELPLYGTAPKTKAEIAADQKFIAEAVAAAGSKEKAADQMIVRGQEALQQYHSAAAMKRFNQAYLLNPNDYRVYWGLGAASGQLGKLSEAIELIAKAESINNKDPRLLADHGFALVSEVVSGHTDQETAIKNLASAEKLYRRAVDLAPKDPLPYSRLAVLMYYKGDLQHARHYVKKSQEYGGEGLDPRFLRDLEKAEKQQANKKS